MRLAVMSGTSDGEPGTRALSIVSINSSSILVAPSTTVVVPIVGPVLLAMALHPVWRGRMIAINLQTSFLTPPFGFALFYLRGVAPPSFTTGQIYRGAIPFVAIQLFALLLIAAFPELVAWLPGKIYGQ